MSLGGRAPKGGRGLLGLLSVWVLLAAPIAQAVPAEESIDDPKLARRLGTRMTWEAPPGVPPPTPPAAVPPPGGPAVVGVPAVQGVAAGAAGLPVAARPARAVASPNATGSNETGSNATASNETGFGPVLPRAQIAFRRFDFVRIGASDAAGLPAAEAFDSLSIDVYPVSSLIRVGLSTAYGWQEGKSSGGDYFATETGSFGVQLGGQRVVPFAEGLAGVGYLRRIEFHRTIPTVTWQLGIDVGAALYLARVGFVSLAVGYLHPVSGFAKEQAFESVYTNTWSFKIGLGI
jgi:hypothetical protein